MKNIRLQVMPETLLKRDSEIFAIFIRKYLFSPIKINIFSGKVTKFPSNVRSSRSQMFFKIGVLKNSQIAQENTCDRTSF